MPGEYSNREALERETTEQRRVVREQAEEREQYAEDLSSLESMLESVFNVLDTFLFGGAIGKLIGFLEKAISDRKIDVTECNKKIEQSQQELEKKQEKLTMP